MIDKPPTTAASIRDPTAASAKVIHEATVWGGIWTARCDVKAGWTVPLIHDPEAAILFVTCPDCRKIRDEAPGV